MKKIDNIFFLNDWIGQKFGQIIFTPSEAISEFTRKFKCKFPDQEIKNFPIIAKEIYDED